MNEYKQEEEILSSQQRTAEIVTLITFILLIGVSIVTIFFVPAEDKTIIDNFIIPIIAIGAGYSYYLARQGKHLRGIYLLLGMIAIVSLLYPLVANNVGWQTAIGMLLITTSIANGTLPTKVADRISAGAFILAIAVVLIELFATGITNIPITISSIVVIIVFGIIYLAVILYRFRQYSLQTKLVMAFISLSILSVSAAAVTINRIISTEITEQVGKQLTQTSLITASAVSEELYAEINILQTLAIDLTLRNEVTENPANSNLAQLQALDEKWRNAVLANSQIGVMRTVLNNETSTVLVNFKERFPAHLEIFVTDVYGATIASTNLTSDYYQADEIWWQEAYNSGNGGVYISQPIFDESSQALALQVAMPIIDRQNGNIIGILRTTLDLDIFADELLSARPGNTGRTEIYLPDGREIELHLEEDGEFEIEVEEAPLDLVSLLQQNLSFMDTVHDGEPVLLGQSQLPEEEERSEFIRDLGWRVVTLQSRDDALATITNVSRVSQLIGLAAIAVASLLALALTQYLTRPISRLIQATEKISAGNLQTRVEAESPDEIGALATSFNRMTNQLRENLVTLEKRVAERTTDLEIARNQSEKRTNQLVSIGEISKIVNVEQNLDILLPLITRLVSERFGFYHTGIFLIEETKQFAVLQAANSIGGQVMLKRGHKLKIGESGIVGYVAKFGTPRIALDVGLDAVYFNNPDLPNTRSEMALPLKLRDTIIGVLDVQSEKPGAFSTDDANTLSILADQITISIDNARLLSQTQQTLGEVQTLYRQNLQAGWKNFSRDEAMVGYRQGLAGGKKITETIGTAEIQQALNRGDTMVTQSSENGNEQMLLVPIKLRGQVIGVMRIQPTDQNKKWSNDEINLSEAVSERLSLALENARLIQESQRQVIKEQAISEITSRIGSSINLENVLQTAVEELGRSIPGSEVIIKLKEESPNLNGGLG